MTGDQLPIIPALAFWAERMGCHPTPGIIVAIPARDEAAHIGACLDALAQQIDGAGAPLPPGAFGVVLLLNNCRDDTAAIAARRAAAMAFPLRIVQWELPPSHAHAGAARRLAMDAAAGWLMAGEKTNGVVLTTDADSTVAGDWVFRQREAFTRGADAIAGLVLDEPVGHHRLPIALRRRGWLEDRYGALLTELRSRLDPELCDPWPRHAMASGASLGVTLAAYRSVGGVPLRPLGEDRALLQALEHRDAWIRHCPDTRVTTSCRLDGRAQGGMAETIRQRIADPEALCDEALEPVLDAIHRSYWRGTLRRQHAAGQLSEAGDWADFLGIEQTLATRLAAEPYFGAFWHQVERASPLLRAHRLRPMQLPLEIKRTRGVLAWLRREGAEEIHGRAAVAS
jgi:Glycosyl transferase family 2